MNKEQRAQLVECVRRMKAVESLLQTEGFQLFLADMRQKRERYVDSAKTQVESHPLMANRVGRVSALDEVLEWADKVMAAGQSAFQNLRDKNEGGDDDG